MEILCLALQIYFYVLLARIVVSWVTAFNMRIPEGLQPVVRLLYDITEPVMGPVRRMIPPFGGIDLSPILLFIAFRFLMEALGC